MTFSFVIECIRQLLRKHVPETKSRYHLERSDYTNHLTVTVNRQALLQQQQEEGQIALKSKKADKQHDVVFTIYAPTVFATLRAALGISHEDFLMVRNILYVEMYLLPQCVLFIRKILAKSYLILKLNSFLQSFYLSQINLGFGVWTNGYQNVFCTMKNHT